MCGIVGVHGIPGAARHTHKALERLEYRGYDSVGIAWNEHGAVDVAKATGRVASLEHSAPGSETVAIGHTRWATHGAVTLENTHPHLDATGQFAVVHNGTLGDVPALRRALEASGAVFRSETDSECIVHLYGQARQTQTPLEALATVLGRITGTYAFLILDTEANAVLFARHQTPLVALPTAAGTVLASDVTALLDHGRDVLYLEDGDHGIVDADGLRMWNAHGDPRKLATTRIDWTPEEAERSGHEHFMAKEIHEVPAALNRALGGRLDSALEIPESLLADARRIVLVGCGSSLQAARVGGHLFEAWARLPTHSINASEVASRPVLEPTDTLFILMSQSGETRDILLALERLRASGHPLLAVTNVRGSTLERTVPSMMLRVGPEVAVAATKSYAAQIACLAALALRTGVLQGSLIPHEAKAVRDELERLPRYAEAVLLQESAMQPLAQSLGRAHDAFILGRGVHAATAAEAALKLKEIAYVHAEAFDAAELKHGPQALLSSETPCLFFLGDDEDAAKTLHNLMEVRARGAPVHVIRTAGPSLEDLDGVCETVTVLEAPAGPLAAVVHGLASQLVAYHAALGLGREIDRPRHLAKSVTVD